MSIPFIKDDETSGPGIYAAGAGLVRVVANNAGPFTYTGTGTYVLHSGTACLVIDPGPHSDTHIQTILSVVGKRSIDAILVTHTHRDHSPGAALLRQLTGAPVIGCAPARQNHGAAVQLDEAQDYDYTPDRVVAAEDTLAFDFVTLKPVATPGHLANHLSFHWLEEDALFCGDHVMGWATSVVIPPDGNMGDYMCSLHETLDMNVKQLWPTHGQPIAQPAPFISALIEHREQREVGILREIDAGTGAIMDIVAQLYQDIDPVLHPAAAQSVFAHIIHLMDQGRVETPERVDIGAFYKPT
ncbi:MAG: MBL fold metallo-hydrolase [Pseudomonadota bacterium]